MGALHSHSHSHATSDSATGAGSLGGRRAFFIGIVLNLAFVVVEFAFGIVARSMALIADAGHNLSDALALGLAAAASLLARRKPSERRTYGFRRATILAALTNALLLVGATGGIAWESIGRLRHPDPIKGTLVSLVALAGVIVNGSSALLFLRGGKRDINQRSAFLHLASDAGVSAGVVVTGIVIATTGWNALDSLVSILLSFVILVSTWSLLRRSLDLALDAVPEGIDPSQVRGYLIRLPGVLEVHDLHIWAMSSTETALTAHLVMQEGIRAPEFLRNVCGELEHRFEIQHSTLQVEAHDAPDPCRLAPDEVL